MAETVVILIAVVAAVTWLWHRRRQAVTVNHPDDLGAALSRGRAKQRGFRSGPPSGQDGGPDQA